MKVAETLTGPVTATVHVNCEPLQAPPQPANTFPPGSAVKVTDVPLSANATQLLPQLIVLFESDTVPPPVLVMVSTSGTTLTAVSLAGPTCAPTSFTAVLTVGTLHKPASAQMAWWVSAS